MLELKETILDAFFSLAHKSSLSVHSYQNTLTVHDITNLINKIKIKNMLQFVRHYEPLGAQTFKSIVGR